MPVLLEMVKRALGRVNRNMREIRAAQPFDLGIEIGKVTALQQRIVAEVDARHNVIGAERDLFGLREEIVDTAIQHQPADLSDRHFLFRDELGCVQYIEGELFGKFHRRRVGDPAPIPGSFRIEWHSRNRAGGNRDRRH